VRTGGTKAGGIAGSFGISSEILDNVFSTAHVEANAYKGGLVGWNSGVMSNSSYQFHAEQRNYACSGYGAATCTQESTPTYYFMETNVDEFDFVSTWSMPLSYGYPVFKYQNNPQYNPIFVPATIQCADTHVSSISPNSNYAIYTSATVGYAQDGMYFLPMLDAVAGIAAVTNAKINLYLDATTLSGPINLSFSRIQTTWTAGTVTYNTKPTAGSPVTSWSMPSSSIGYKTSPDLSALMLEMAFLSPTTRGVAILGNTLGSTDTVSFITTESSSAYKPYLEMTVNGQNVTLSCIPTGS
jgi:hypothetical protein